MTLLAQVRNLFSRASESPRTRPAKDGTAARIELSDGAACLVVVKDGRVLHHTGDLALSHAEFVRRTVGTLPEGAWVGTIRKFSGEIVALSSKTFYGNQLPAPPEVMEAIRTLFH